MSDLRDNRVGTGGEGILVCVDVWNSEIEQEVDKEGAKILS